MLYLAHILLAVAWAAITGSFSVANLLFGLVLGAFVLFLIREQVGALGYFRRSRLIGSLALLFVVELVKSAWNVLVVVLRRDMDLKPGIFAYELTVESDFEITLLANFITLTPGTLSVDVSADRRTLYIHALDCADVEQTCRDIAEGFERRIMEAFR